MHDRIGKHCMPSYPTSSRRFRYRTYARTGNRYAAFNFVHYALSRLRNRVVRDDQNTRAEHAIAMQSALYLPGSNAGVSREHL